MSKAPSGTAVVTGGTAGIGLETAVGLTQAGYQVTVIGRDEATGPCGMRASPGSPYAIGSATYRDARGTV
jgi:NAD(P)-dependent dehydrogenase (short-subunit alcohol dehydrogenase family)